MKYSIRSTLIQVTLMTIFIYYMVIDMTPLTTRFFNSLRMVSIKTMVIGIPLSGILQMHLPRDWHFMYEAKNKTSENSNKMQLTLGYFQV